MNDTTDLVDKAAFGSAVAPVAPRHGALNQLRELLQALDPTAPIESRIEQLERLFKWIRATGKVPATDSADPGDRPQVSRLRLLIVAIDRFPQYRLALAGVIHSVLTESSGLMLFARLGLPNDRGFWAETVDRLSRRFLPEPVDPNDLAQTLGRLLPSQRDAVWLSSAPVELLGRLVGAGEFDDARPLLSHVSDALALLATRASAIGLSDAIRVRSGLVSLGDSPYFKLPRTCDALIAAARTADHGSLETHFDACRTLVAECREVVEKVISNLEQYGVSVDVVYRLELAQNILDRIEVMAALLAPATRTELLLGAQKFLVILVQARVKDRDLGEISRNNLHLLARKVIERAGDTGEHYITSSRLDYAKMLMSAGGGGFLTTFTCALKYITVWGHFAPFVEGVLASTNYALSFILMQFLGFTLATKQPSMTAAALAGSMRSTAGQTDLSGLVTMIARITRSQLAAAVGNVGVVIPSALAFDHVHRQYFGRSFLDEETAHHVVESLHPTHSGTIFYGALTGVLLWASSIGAGWLENWAVYRRLPEAIAEHRIRRFIGSRATRFASRVFAHNIAGIGGNTTLGFMLGMTPVMGKFFGLPLDVRHVTLSTGALTLAGCSLGAETLVSTDYLAAAGGIAIIGSLNFGVSFVLALAVALRARQVERSDRFKLWRSVFATFVRSPMQFLFPPRSDAEAPVHGPVSVRPPPVH
jgi:site-specific recombinase